MPAVIPLLAELMAIQDRRGLPDSTVARTMGIESGTLTKIKRDWSDGKGSHILTIVGYAKAIGAPLIPVEDPNFAPPTQVNREHLIAEAARLRREEELTYHEIAVRLDRSVQSVNEYIKAAKARNLLAP